MLRFRNTVLFDVLLLLLVVAVGVSGYMLIEHWHFLDALFMTTITLTTIGYGEVHPLSQSGRIFTIFLIAFGIGTITYTVSSITSFFLKGQFTSFLNSRAMQQRIEDLKDHVIVCGASDTSIGILNELSAIKQPFVLIDRNEERLRTCSNGLALLSIVGDATDEKTLKKVHVERAKALIACLSSDHENVFLVMNARELNPHLTIVARLKEESSRKNLIRAGVDEIVNPYRLGGMRLASLVVRPEVVRFLDKMLYQNHATMRVEEIVLTGEHPYVVKPHTVEQIQKKEGARLISWYRFDHNRYEIHFDDTPLMLKNGDVLIFLKQRMEA